MTHRITYKTPSSHMISKCGIFLSKTMVIQDCAVVGLFSLLLCLWDSCENEIYHSWMTELNNNVVNRRSLWILLFPLLPEEWKFITTTTRKKNMIINWLLPTPPILLPNPELISPHWIYHRESLGRKNTKVGRWEMSNSKRNQSFICSPFQTK